MIEQNEGTVMSHCVSINETPPNESSDELRLSVPHNNIALRVIDRSVLFATIVRIIRRYVRVNVYSIKPIETGLTTVKFVTSQGI